MHLFPSDGFAAHNYKYFTDVLFIQSKNKRLSEDNEALGVWVTQIATVDAFSFFVFCQTVFPCCASVKGDFGTKKDCSFARC